MALVPLSPAAQMRRALATGHPVHRELAAGEVHRYEIHAANGDFMAISVQKQGADAVSVLIGPDGHEIARARGHDSPYREEVIAVTAEATGSYTLEVRAASPRSGRYSLELNELRPSRDGDQSRVEAESMFERAAALQATGRSENYVEAATLSAAALERFRRVADRRGTAKALSALAANETNLARPGAIETAYAAEQATRDLGDVALRAASVTTLGYALIRAGDLAQALARFEEASQLAHANGDTWEEAAAIINAGTIYGRRGESEQAAEEFQRARALTRAGGYGRLEMDALSDLGIAYQDLGDFEEAADAYRQALAKAKERGDRSRQALVLNNLGNLERMLGRNQDSVAHHMEALALSREVGSRENESRSLNTLSGTYYALGRYADALDYARQALAIRKQTLDLYGQGTSLREIGRALVKLGDAEGAMPALQESLNILHRIEEGDGQVATLTELAAAERSRGNILVAVDDAKAAIEIEERLRTRVTSPALRGSFAALAHNKYELLIDLLLQQQEADSSAGHDVEALRVAERVRARLLLESLVESRVDLRQGIEPALLERERALQKQLNGASAELTRALSARTPDGSRTDAASKNVEQLTNDYQQVEAEIRRQSPAYAAVTQPEPLRADEVQRAVLDDDTILLEFALGDERSWLWAVTTADVTSVALPARDDRGRVAEDVRVVRRASAATNRIGRDIRGTRPEGRRGSGAPCGCAEPDAVRRRRWPTERRLAAEAARDCG